MARGSPEGFINDGEKDIGTEIRPLSLLGPLFKTPTIMKKILFYFAILCMLVISACRSDKTMCGRVRAHYVGY